MKSMLRAGGLCCTMMAMLVTGSLLFAQDAKKPDSKAPTTKKAATRLPPIYGKLNLSDEQKTKIRAVVATHAARIAELNAQLSAARDK